MSELIICINNLLNVQRNIVEKLNEKIVEIEQHHEDCNFSNTVGAGAGIVGTIGLISAPFTGGLSLLIAGVATGAMVAGAATTIGTSVIDIIKSKGFLDEVNELVKTQEAAAEKFKLLLNNLKAVVTSYKDQNDCSDEDAWAMVLLVCTSGSENLLKSIASTTGSMDSARAIKFAKDIAELHKAGTFIFRLSILARLPVGATAEGAAALGKVGAKMGGHVAAKSGRAILGTMGKTLVIVGNVVDVASVIYGWSTKHPTLKEIEELRDNMKASIDNLEKFLQAVELLQDD